MRFARLLGSTTRRKPIAKFWQEYNAPYDNVSLYENGTLFAVHLDDKLDGGRYIIKHKLGKGSRSHIWFAKDLKLNCYVAIKLLPKALANAESNNEVSILEHVQQQASESKSGSEYIRRYIRRFTEHHAGKEYHGIVMQATGQSIQDRIVWHGISFAAAKTIGIGTIRGLRFLQEDCKVAHGDLYFGNICLAAPDFATMNDDQVYESLGPVCKQEIIRKDGGPPHSFVPRYSIEDASFFSDGPIKIIDFGAAWRFGNRPDHVRIYPTYRPPELIGKTSGLKNDIGLDSWMLGCTIFRLLTGGWLFDALPDDGLRDQINAICNNPNRTPKEALYQRISENVPEVSECDRRHLARILGGLIVEDPEKRLSAAELERDLWLQL